jgi:tripartite motif-containing protein 71
MSRLSRFMHIRCAVLATSVALVALLALGGCGATDHPGQAGSAPSAGPASGCPGADPCPYRSVAIIGTRAEGVLRFPEALALAPEGDVYVADQYSYVVQRFTAHGRFLGQWGSHGTGPGQFGAVSSLAVSSAGEVYLVDAEHDRVEEFNPEGRFVRAWGSPGSGLGQFDFGPGGLGVPPGGAIAVAGSYVFVSDTGNDRVERFTLQGTEPLAWGTHGHGPGQLEDPRGLAARGRALYVADDGDNRIEEFDVDGRFIRQEGTFGTRPGQFADPFDVAVGPRGHVYVADDNNHRVVQLTARLHYVNSLELEAAQAESAGLHPNLGGEQVSYPRALVVAPGDAIYVAEAAGNRIFVFGGNGQLFATWGISGRAYGQFMLPRDVAVGPTGDALVTDTLGGRIEIFNGPFSDAPFSYRGSFRGGGGIVGKHLFKPVALARASDGSLWVTDQENNLLRHLGPDGQLLGTLGGGPAGAPGSLRDPGGVAIGRRGDIYAADTGADHIQRYSAGGVPLGFWGGEGSAPGLFHGPVALAAARGGDVYVVDRGNDRIEKFTATGHFLGMWGASGQAPGQFRGPEGIAVDELGDVFVSDTGNDRIQEFNAHGRFLRLWGAPGAQPGELSGPAGMSIGCDGALLVADTDNNRVQRFGGVAHASHCAPPPSE